MMRISHAKIWQNGILDNGTEGAKALRYHALGELEIQKKSSMAGRYEIRKGMVQDEVRETGRSHILWALRGQGQGFGFSSKCEEKPFIWVLRSSLCLLCILGAPL